jgi:hypothetical protein
MCVFMIVIMQVIVRYFGLPLGSLICLCHLSRGQNPCLPGNVCVCRAAPLCVSSAATPYYYCTRLQWRGSNASLTSEVDRTIKTTI